VRHGVVPTGKIDERTFYAMAVTADQRLAQLQLNQQRVTNETGALADSYVAVNIPAASLEAIDGGMVTQRHTAVVGRIDRPTPLVNSKIMQINFNPFWHVPKSIIQKDLIPQMQKDPTYLADFHIRAYNSKGQEVDPSTVDWTSPTDALNYAFTQDPGAFNSEGHVKINFPSPDDVYLHDTPEKELFAEDERFDSSGCVRVKDVDQLVTWLLRENGGWALEDVQSAMESNQRLDVTLKKQTPLHTTYVTAWSNRMGTVSFRDDVYQLDAQGQLALSSG
jgi:murein L,D-transpeptidase YcbB/YkuD